MHMGEPVVGTSIGRDDKVVVAGAGGFIGGHLVAELRRAGCRDLRAVDAKPVDRWHQSFADVENVPADLKDPRACAAACADARWVFNLAADMGGMGFIEAHKAECMLSVLINTNLLLAARDAGVERFFFASTASVYAADPQARPEVTARKEVDA